MYAREAREPKYYDKSRLSNSGAASDACLRPDAVGQALRQGSGQRLASHQLTHPRNILLQNSTSSNISTTLYLTRGWLSTVYGSHAPQHSALSRHFWDPGPHVSASEGKISLPTLTALIFRTHVPESLETALELLIMKLFEMKELGSRSLCSN